MTLRQLNICRKSIATLHWQLVSSWVEGNHTEGARSLDNLCLALLRDFRQSTESAGLQSLESPDDDSASVEPTLNRQVTWALNKVNQFRARDATELQLVATLSRVWLEELQAALAMTDDLAAVGQTRVACTRYVIRLSTTFGDPVAQWPRVTSEQYTVKLQLSLLGLSNSQLREPVLDVGCGKDAELVHWLRRQGKNAIGIDLVGNAAKGAIAIDWLDFPFVPEHFGTIIGHLSFSLHFLKHHLDATGDAEKYAALYMRILRALQVGGRAIYAPGLPFIEKLLPQEVYRVQRLAVANLPGHERGLRVYAALLGESPLYACHVERVAK